MRRSERDKFLNRKIDQRFRQQQQDQERRRRERELRQREQAAMAVRSTKELTGEVKPTPPGESDKQKIITVPFDGTIRSVSYTPNEFLHVGAQGTGVPLRDMQLYRTSPQR